MTEHTDPYRATAHGAPHPILLSAKARNDAGHQVFARTAEAMTQLADAVRYDTLVEVGARVEGFDLGLPDDAHVGWFRDGHEIARASRYDQARAQDDLAAFAWGVATDEAESRQALLPRLTDDRPF